MDANRDRRYNCYCSLVPQQVPGRPHRIPLHELVYHQQVAERDQTERQERIRSADTTARDLSQGAATTAAVDEAGHDAQHDSLRQTGWDAPSPIDNPLVDDGPVQPAFGDESPLEPDATGQLIDPTGQEHDSTGTTEDLARGSGYDFEIDVEQGGSYHVDIEVLDRSLGLDDLHISEYESDVDIDMDMLTSLEQYASSLPPETRDIIQQYIWKLEHGVSDRAFDSRPHTMRPANNDTDIPQTAKGLRRYLMNLTSFRMQRVACCVKMCQVFHDIDTTQASVLRCDECNEPIFYQSRVDGRLVWRPRNYYYHFPIRQRLQYEMANAAIAKERNDYMTTATRPGHEATGKIYRDCWDGDTFAERNDQGREVMAFGLSMDGVMINRQPSSKASVWPIILYNLSDPPQLRANRLLLVGLIPSGPSGPLDSFLKLVLDEFSTPLRVFDGHLQTWRTVELRISLVSGDTPAIAKMMCLKQPGGYSSCRFCTIHGRYCRNSRTVCYPLPGADDDPVLMRDPLTLRDDILRLYAGEEHDNIIDNASGFLSASSLINEPALIWPDSFPLDTMHLFENISALMLRVLLTPSRGPDANEDDALLPIVDSNTFKLIGQCMENAARTIPVSVARTPRNIAVSRNSFKATEHLSWLLQFSMPLLWSLGLPQEDVDIWLLFITSARLAMQTSISNDQVNAIQRHLEEFVVRFQEKYVPSNVLRNANSQVHALLHLSHCIRTMGPAWSYWQFGVERYVGTLEAMATSQRHIHTSLANSLEVHETLRLVRDVLYNIPTTKRTVHDATANTSHGQTMLDATGDTYGTLTLPVKNLSARRIHLMRSAALDRSLANFFGNDIWEQSRSTFTEWKKMSFRVTSGTASTFDVLASNHDLKPLDGRCRSYVEYNSDGCQTEFGKVETIIACPETSCVALVLRTLPRRYDPALTALSHAGFYGVRAESQGALAVIDARAVSNPVGLLRTPPTANRNTLSQLPHSWIVRPYRID